MIVLALDLGTCTGWACGADPSGAFEVAGSGVWDLRATGSDHARRLESLRTSLLTALRQTRYDVLAFEDVPAQAHRGGQAAHVWGALWGTTLACCAVTGTRYLGVGIASWKRAAGLRAGTGPAEALEAAQARWPGVRFGTADEAVARFVAVAAAAQVSR